MIITKENLIDVLEFYMEDNEFDYVSIKASIGANGSLMVSIFEDIELEDEDDFSLN
jgi:hypothetical protein